jgi:hypothetical protein
MQVNHYRLASCNIQILQEMSVFEMIRGVFTKEDLNLWRMEVIKDSAMCEFDSRIDEIVPIVSGFAS